MTYKYGRLVQYDIQRAIDALQPGIAKVPNVQYTLDGSEPKKLNGVTGDRKQDPQNVPTVIKFKADGYNSEVLEFSFFTGVWPTVLQVYVYAHIRIYAYVCMCVCV